MTTTSGPSTTSPPADPCHGATVGEVERSLPVPPDIAAEIAARLADPRWDAVETSVSVSIEGYGEVASRGSGLALLPASNQKLSTAIGAHLLLDQGHRFTTSVRLTPAGDLVLVAGGDPTLGLDGDHSLATLATRTAAAHPFPVRDVVVDATRYEVRTALDGWQDWQIPTYVGPLSALMVDDNRHRSDAAYLADPARGNGEAFLDRLISAGIETTGTLVVADSPVVLEGSRLVAALESAPVADLLVDLLTHSDNMVGESLVREIGAVVAGEGSTAAGLEVIDDAVDGLCVATGTSGDGSGLSRSNRRSADDWRRLLVAVQTEPWFEVFLDELAVAGRTGTLAQRLTGPATAGVVRAKSGSIIGGRALSGYLSTASGRRVVFSAIVNGDASATARDAIDELLVTIATYPAW